MMFLFFFERKTKHPERTGKYIYAHHGEGMLVIKLLQFYIDQTNPIGKDKQHDEIQYSISASDITANRHRLDEWWYYTRWWDLSYHIVIVLVNSTVLEMVRKSGNSE